ncbi:MAG TPA: cysteine desulfurase-like protein [Pseudogracilibacillus sp.]|nr:cysteine desulfurase-like protein [Pseudogracilibacillus sp.]
MVEHYPIDKVREQFPALQRIEHDHFVAYFDGPGGTQVAGRVIDAMANYMKNGVANLGGTYSTAMETAFIVEEARQHVANLLGAKKENIAFGANMTTLAFRVARALSSEWSHSKGNIVVTEMDHHANIDPWVTAALEKGIEVRYIPFQQETKTLQLEKLDEIISDDTKLVAVGLASNAIGTITDCAKIIQRAKDVGALVIVDAVHAVPHFVVDFEQLGADVLFCSAYKFFGPHVGIVAIEENLFNRMHIFKLRPASDEYPAKLETGTLNFEGLVGVIEAVRFMASIGEGNILREQILSAYEKMERYEHYLAERLRQGLQTIDYVMLHQANDNVKKTPTVSFQVDRLEAKDVCQQLARKYALHLEYGDFYAQTLVEKMGLDRGGLIRAGIAPYNTVEEIDRLIEAVQQIDFP